MLGKVPRRKQIRTFLPAVAIATVIAAAGGAWWIFTSIDAIAPPIRRKTLPQASTSQLSPRAEFTAIADALYDGPNPYFGRTALDQLLAQLDNENLPPLSRVQLLAESTLAYLRLGEIEAAKRQIEMAFSVAESDEQLRGRVPDLYRVRGLVHLREAELSNCVAAHNAACCIFPLEGAAQHKIDEPARNAREDYETYLRLMPGQPDVAWLLNIVNMAIGEYPNSVPEPYRIPQPATSDVEHIARFTDVAPERGLNAISLAGGCVVEDFNNDGWLDIVVSTMDPRESLRYYQNLGAGQFKDITTTAGLDDQLGGLNLNAADYDNDGDMDLLVLRGAWLFDDGQIRNSLLRQNPDGTFTDVTHAAGLADPPRPTQAAAWGDFDNDGDLDLYVGNESREAWDKTGQFDAQYFRNNGDGTFTDIAEQAGVTNERYCKGVAAGDFDNDGDLDLYLSNILKNRLYRNNGDGTFTDIAEQLDMRDPERSFPTWFFDYDNDGRLDLFVAAYRAPISELFKAARGEPRQALLPALYRNTGGATFQNVTASVGLDNPYMPMGAGFGDIDNDGWLDIYLGTGDPNFESLMPNVLLRNDAGVRFQDVTVAAGVGHLQKGHGVSFADIDNDGDQDIFHELGGMYPGDRFYNALFLNPANDGPKPHNHFITVKLVGTRSNRSAVGARLKIVAETPIGPREIHRAVGITSSFGWTPLRQEIGLGAATAINRIEIDWHTSGQRQIVDAPPMDRFITITEGQPGYDILHQADPQPVRHAGTTQ